MNTSPLQNSQINNIYNYNCIIKTCVITGIVLTILGTLGIIGFYLPNSILGALNAIGVWNGFILATGLFLIAFAIAIVKCSTRTDDTNQIQRRLLDGQNDTRFLEHNRSISDLESHNQRLQTENNSLQHQLTLSRQALITQQTLNQENNRSISDLQSLNQSLQTRNNTLQHQLTLSTQTLSRQETLNQENNRSISDLESHNQRLQTENNSLQHLLNLSRQALITQQTLNQENNRTISDSQSRIQSQGIQHESADREDASQTQDDLSFQQHGQVDENVETSINLFKNLETSINLSKMELLTANVRWLNTRDKINPPFQEESEGNQAPLPQNTLNQGERRSPRDLIETARRHRLHLQSIRNRQCTNPLIANIAIYCAHMWINQQKQEIEALRQQHESVDEEAFYLNTLTLHNMRHNLSVFQNNNIVEQNSSNQGPQDQEWDRELVNLNERLQQLNNHNFNRLPVQEQGDQVLLPIPSIPTEERTTPSLIEEENRLRPLIQSNENVGNSPEYIDHSLRYCEIVLELQNREIITLLQRIEQTNEEAHQAQIRLNRTTLNGFESLNTESEQEPSNHSH